MSSDLLFRVIKLDFNMSEFGEGVISLTN